MSLLDSLFSIGPVRNTIWRLWYPFLTRRLRNENVLFLNYAFETSPAVGLPLSAEDEPARANIQLYHHVATQVDLAGKDVVEISCGHGGGAEYLSRTLRPKSYIGLDLNPTGIQFCREKHHVSSLSFVQGNALKLPFADASADAVINVEASHCYASFSDFLSEVHRVLKPGGHFLYADFRFSDGLAAWEKDLATGPLHMVRTRDISEDVIRGLDANAERSEALVVNCLPKSLHSLGRDFAGVPGSRIYLALQRGEVKYRSFCFEKR